MNYLLIIENQQATIESLRQQRARCVWQIVMLRDALKEVQMVAESSVKTHGYDKQHVRNADVAKRALAGINDLKDVRLCHAEQVAFRTFDGEGNYDFRDYYLNEDYQEDWNNRNPNHKGWVEPLYRAWEPK